MYEFWSENVGSDAAVVRYFVIPNFDSVYLVGDDGSIWSRYQKIGWNWIVSNNWTRLNPGRDKDGYFFIHLSFNGVIYTNKVHRLVLEAVSEPCPAGMEVCHNDGNPANNYWWNLRYDTCRGNNIDRITHGTIPRAETHYNAKSNWEQAREIRAKYDTGGYDQEELAFDYSLSRNTISRILNNRAWVESPPNRYNNVGKVIRGKGKKGENNGNAKLKLEQAREIRVKYATGNYTQKDLALEYGLTEPSIWSIIHNKTWVEDPSNQ
jgi:hypothetical protein